MKHLYLLCCMIMLIHVCMAREHGPSALHSNVRPDGPIREIFRSDLLLGIAGQVVDENGAPFPGVNVVLKGTTTGTATDTNGKYAIEVPEDNAILVFSFVGYASQEVAVGGRSTIDVTMNPDIR